jgi:hypothetical protein
VAARRRLDEPIEASRAEANQEERIAALAQRVGEEPPESAVALTHDVYGSLSRHAKRTPILESWRPDLHRFSVGADSSIIFRAIWVSYGDEWVRETYQTGGLTLTKFFPDRESGGHSRPAPSSGASCTSRRSPPAARGDDADWRRRGLTTAGAARRADVLPLSRETESPAGARLTPAKDEKRASA